MELKLSILIVEDEEKIRIGLRDFLEFRGYGVTEACDGMEARQRVAEGDFDIILLDLMLPKVSGEELCRQWRQSDLQVPIIMLTAKGQEKDKITGLNLGADDYITKPFSLEELHARIQAVLRRTDPARKVGQTFEFGHWQVDIAGLKIRSDNQKLEISKREGEILQYFAAHPHRIISREELYGKVWGETMTELGTRTVDMHIAKLRSKIEGNAPEPRIIKTVRGAGYQYGG
ncbi:MAG: response regulator transcription factor [Sedimentisphaerales bacterium]|nr:response regulator transcription factor [Sedimentisphaerales bacterium]